MPLPASPMQVVALDLIGPFVASSNDNKYILTVIDHFTGWAEAYPIPNKRSQTTEQFFHNRFVAAQGCPEELISDNGCEFTASTGPFIWTEWALNMFAVLLSIPIVMEKSNALTARLRKCWRRQLTTPQVTGRTMLVPLCWLIVSAPQKLSTTPLFISCMPANLGFPSRNYYIHKTRFRVLEPGWIH